MKTSEGESRSFREQYRADAEQLRADPAFVQKLEQRLLGELQRETPPARPVSGLLAVHFAEPHGSGRFSRKMGWVLGAACFVVVIGAAAFSGLLRFDKLTAADAAAQYVSSSAAAAPMETFDEYKMESLEDTETAQPEEAPETDGMEPLKEAAPSINNGETDAVTGGEEDVEIDAVTGDGVESQAPNGNPSDTQREAVVLLSLPVTEVEQEKLELCFTGNFPEAAVTLSGDLLLYRQAADGGFDLLGCRPIVELLGENLSVEPGETETRSISLRSFAKSLGTILTPGRYRLEFPTLSGSATAEFELLCKIG